MQKKKYIQQLHKKCEGEIIIAALSKTNWQFVCKRCAVSWSLSFKPTLPAEMVGVPKKFQINLSSKRRTMYMVRHWRIT